MNTERYKFFYFTLLLYILHINFILIGGTFYNETNKMYYVNNTNIDSENNIIKYHNETCSLIFDNYNHLRFIQYGNLYKTYRVSFVNASRDFMLQNLIISNSTDNVLVYQLYLNSKSDKCK